MQTSKFLTLNWTDVGKGLLVTVGGAFFGAIETSLQAGQLTFDWKAIGTIALAAGLSYLTKNLFSPAQIVTPIDPTK